MLHYQINRFCVWLQTQNSTKECNSTKAVTFDGMGSLDHWKVMGGKKFKTVDLEC